MDIVVCFNPIAGAGQAAAAGQAVSEAIRSAGHTPRIVETSVAPIEHWLGAELRQADGLVAVGGDGTVRLLAPAAVATNTPLYQFPLGTENLFAREFGMDRDLPRLVAALEAGVVRNVDLGRANDHTFILMVSVGFDAAVVHDLASRRTGAISHASYAGPIFRQFIRWKPTPMEITVDGIRINDGQSGFVVIANCREYGRRLNPARQAIMDDGLLDVVFFPTASRCALLAWAIRCHRGVQLEHVRVKTCRGRAVRVTAATPLPFQIDGDRPSPPGAEASGASGVSGGSPVFTEHTPLEVSIEHGVLPVLLPPESTGGETGAYRRRGP